MIDLIIFDQVILSALLFWRRDDMRIVKTQNNYYQKADSVVQESVDLSNSNKHFNIQKTHFYLSDHEQSFVSFFIFCLFSFLSLLYI